MNPRAKLIIPTLVLLATMVSAAYASFSVLTLTSQTTVQEDITGVTTQDFAAHIFPGESTTWTFTVSNAKTSGAQGVEIHFTSDPHPLRQSVSYSVSVAGDGPNLNPCISGATDAAVCAPISVPAAGVGGSGTVTVTVTLSAAGDAAPGDVALHAEIFRV